ncbi:MULTISPECIES: iron ABC transporter ATP-binding protein [unclassified Cryobacterium]|uniref:iron ABC transporter ATP-binding protein n=1 Tax=unclassified Cryobacterium TaxID=2649013 RepID=UPI00106B377F|nr:MULTISPECIES: iron ABC transporter ATP-binding protein [unclassified Cryobacterium]TFC58839.1 iron ABC transporter ATP-binding protein [Cryobacterium sp. TMB3-1-2]TFC70473.1 iron ABC transporter ATP-binding protein [Cryobacterium sp. TMB3-15]TFC73831.1 iron ABC transporter ATP-binding protein [Cryobacterium sp. TMB3-10]TFC89559.1 iron ABC transporter ATP-binding protein [Cryobacterium sp. TMT4-31]TFD42051.1 iron ABC transporter ATP-binding protein [Cryobacterium sp. TMB3-12]
MTHSSSSSFATGRRLRAALALTGASLALIALAGCAPAGDTEPTASATAKPTSTATSEPTATAEPTVSATASATPAPAAEGTAVDKSCDQVLTADDVYEINPNVSVDPGYSASSDTAVTATTYNGIACGWINNSSGEVIEVSVAMPNEALANTLKDAALAGGEVVPTYGSAPDVEGYFSADTGTAQVFTGGYWVAVSSPAMIEPGDAERVMSTVIGNL